jgi:hypothetical protein
VFELIGSDGQAKYRVNIPVAEMKPHGAS